MDHKGQIQRRNPIPLLPCLDPGGVYGTVCVKRLIVMADTQSLSSCCRNLQRACRCSKVLGAACAKRHPPFSWFFPGPTSSLQTSTWCDSSAAFCMFRSLFQHLPEMQSSFGCPNPPFHPGACQTELDCTANAQSRNSLIVFSAGTGGFWRQSPAWSATTLTPGDATHPCCHGFAYPH